MSRHEARKHKTEKPESAEMKAAKLHNEIHGIETAVEFEREWGRLNDVELHKAAFEFEMLGFRLRHMLWNRREKDQQGN